MSSKIDVRIIKTKERLKNALLESLKIKSLDQITISEICNKASVNRNTFYSHYQSVNELLEEVEGQFLEGLMVRIHVDPSTIDNVEPLMTEVFEFLLENKEMCRLLFMENGDKNFLKTIFMLVLPSAVQNWTEELNIPEEKARKLFYFIIGGSINVIEHWVKSDFIDSPEDLAHDLNLLILKGQDVFVM